MTSATSVLDLRNVEVLFSSSGLPERIGSSPVLVARVVIASARLMISLRITPLPTLIDSQVWMNDISNSSGTMKSSALIRKVIIGFSLFMGTLFWPCARPHPEC